jgi:hypothetical protein
MTADELRTLFDSAAPRCARCRSRATSIEWTTADGGYPEVGDVVATFLCGEHSFSGTSYWVHIDDLLANFESWERHFKGKRWAQDLVSALALTLRRLSRIGGDASTVLYEVYIFSDPPLVKVGIARNSAKRSRDVANASGRPNIVVRTWTVGSKDAARRVEASVHLALRTHRREGEWFAVTPSAAAAAVESALSPAEET